MTVEEGAGRGTSFAFAQPDVFLIGRSPEAHLVIASEDGAVSRRHCLLEVVPPRCYIRDLGSTNGTFVNGVKVSQAELRHGDLISLGRTTLRLTLPAAASVAGICGLCGESFSRGSSAAASAIPAEEGICQRCRDEHLLPVEACSEHRQAPGPITCSGCEGDLSEVANCDGLAEVFRDTARYLCPPCADARFNLAKERKCGDFRLLQQLGAGGMGVVFLAWDPRSCRLGALKKISLPFPDELTVRRFLRETRLMAGIIHANIVRLFRQGIHQGVPFLVTEFLDGGSVSDRLDEAGGKLPIGDACRWACDLLAGLSRFHELGHVHRDIKPANMLLLRQGEGIPEVAKLADFGLAKSFSAAGGTMLTQGNSAGGSLLYMPPEQIASFRTVGPPADVYALGISLYQMVAGVLPFAEAMKSASSQKDVLIILLEEQPAPLRTCNPDIPQELAAIIERAISRNPANRPSAPVLRASLSDFLKNWTAPR